MFGERGQKQYLDIFRQMFWYFQSFSTLDVSMCQLPGTVVTQSFECKSETYHNVK